MSDLSKALEVAIRVHADQRDKWGEPYLLHVLRVVDAVDGERAKVLAALHAVLEDAVTAPSLEELFGEDGMWIENSIEVLTRGPNETYAEYIEGIRDGHSSTWVAEVREVKLADLRDNLDRIISRAPFLPNWDELRRRHEKAITILEAAA
jgi:(p)ppGpp synthase/HD superfamily hydrolase